MRAGKTSVRLTAMASTPSSPAGAAPDAELQELRDWKRRLGLLLDFTKVISSKRDLSALLILLVENAAKILKSERCTVFLLDKNKNELWSRVASGEREIRVPAGRGIVGEAMLARRVINIPDAYADKRFNQDVDRATGYRTRNLLTAPMVNAKGEVIGAFQVLNKTSGAFDSDDEKILLLVTEQAASAVENAQLYEIIRDATKDTIFRLAAAAEYKDLDTKKHLERMSRYSRMIAESMGLSEDFCESLFLASPMHDIGKLGVPDAILRKPGRLDEKEWLEMRKHPVYGADILSHSENELLQMSERVARSHHEKWDGTGYPDGLKGEAIPLEARIVALADVFDALTSKRCYKPAFTLSDSLKIIEDGAGQHFDPRVVAAFKKVVPEATRVMEEFSDKPEDPPPFFDGRRP